MQFGKRLASAHAEADILEGSPDGLKVEIVNCGLISQLTGLLMTTAEIAVVWNRPCDRNLWLPRLREWTTANAPFLQKLGIKNSMQSFNSPDAALCWRAEVPNERLVVASGFSRREIETYQNSAVSSGEPIIVGDPGAASLDCNASASFLNGEPIVTCRDVRSQIRKSLIRVALRRRVQIRPPSSDAELSGYFALRYKVWKSIGYLRDENKQARTEFEIDFWDRTAAPLCAITQDGRVIGCARLISAFGDEQPCVAKIKNLLDHVNDPKLHELFRFPNNPQLPFDILFEFPGFGARFQALIRSRVKMAEIGRVAVDPEYRGQCLSEALVDTAVASAKARQVSCIFLACHEGLAPLYARCGFVAVQGLRSDKFFNIQRPSIVMERRV